MLWYEETNLFEYYCNKLNYYNIYLQILIALCSVAQINSHQIPLGVTVGLSPYSHPVVSSQYHAQDNFGQYVYGYATPTSTKTETKTADGVTQGGYSYIDSNGILQTVQYVADPTHGFRVAATNLPRDLPDVAHAKAVHLAQFEAVRAEHAQLAAARTVQYFNPVAVPIAAVPQVNLVALPQSVQDLPEVVRARAEHLAAVQAAYSASAIPPQPVHDLPEVVKARAEHLAAVEATRARDATAAISVSPVASYVAGHGSPVVPVHTVHNQAAVVAAPVAHSVAYAPAVAVHQGVASSQYHAQDELGQYSYGYVEPHSSKAESKSADGITRGGYSYIDANGVLQTVNYISDPVNGFRVAATNLPVAPKTHLIPPGPTTVVHQAPVHHGSVVTANAAVADGLYAHDVYY